MAKRKPRRYNEAWEKQVFSLLRFIDDVVDIHFANGHIWQDKMVAHYQTKLIKLLDRPPPKNKKCAMECRTRLKLALDRLTEQD